MQTSGDFADREIIGFNDDKPKVSLLVELLGCSINDFGKNIGLLLKQLLIPIDKTLFTQRTICLLV